MNIPVSHEYYPYIIRTILRLVAEGKLPEVTSVDIEPDYGYMMRLGYANGAFRVVFGYNFGVNLASSAELAKDKGYTKFILRQMGLNSPKGSEFLLPWWYEEIGRPQQLRGNPNVRTVADAPRYVDEHLSYPVYIKPVDGSRGDDIYLVHDAKRLKEICELYETKRIRVAIIEQPVSLPDYRVVCLDGKLVCAYRRIPLHVVGDGTSTVEQLLYRLQGELDAAGRDAQLDLEDERLKAYLAAHHIDLSDIPEAGRTVILAAISNLSAGGTSDDVTETIHQRWVDVATAVAKGFNLRLIGLDLACADITSPDAAYSIFEVNSSPGFDHYASSGPIQQKRVEDLYLAVLNEPPSI